MSVDRAGLAVVGFIFAVATVVVTTMASVVAIQHVQGQLQLDPEPAAIAMVR